MLRTKPPFRADHVGSLLRSARLNEARGKHERGEIARDALTAVEDEAISASTSATTTERPLTKGLPSGFSAARICWTFWDRLTVSLMAEAIHLAKSATPIPSLVKIFHAFFLYGGLREKLDFWRPEGSRKEKGTA